MSYDEGDNIFRGGFYTRGNTEDTELSDIIEVSEVSENHEVCTEA